ncbi:hypothetical protein HOY80DRAFT_1009289 [Tuber brumale]|nr:hypothetical protein HOY80DRAFT_1009289 [Tuber brumale]
MTDLPPPFTPSASAADLPPPPPAIRHEVSPTSNAPFALAEAGFTFCDKNPLAPPQHLTAASLAEIGAGKLTLDIPPYKTHMNHVTVTSAPGTGLPIVSTSTNCPDTALLSSLPLYAAGYHHPANTNSPKHIYFEVRLLRLPRRADNGAVAIGFATKPYPHFRLPGWNRGSLAVHGDDGHRYCNDAFGGNEFMEAPWRVGDRVGIGMTFGTGAVGGGGGEIWFDKNGERIGGWEIHEEVDSASSARSGGPKIGLDGRWDVYAALGVFGGGIQVEVLKFESV